jgi:hypothetical protein
MFYFGLDSNGFIDSHLIDRRIKPSKPSAPLNIYSIPWLSRPVKEEPELLPQWADFLSAKDSSQLYE